MSQHELNKAEPGSTEAGNAEAEDAGEISLTTRTPRLELIAATPRLVRAELADLDLFSKMLAARVPASWPPELYDRQAAEWTLKYLEGEPERAGWALWYCILPADASSSGRVLAGIAGYKGTPSPEGRVEIGYGVLSEFQRAGYATEAALALVQRAFDRPETEAVTAETFPDITASIRVLEKCGFVLIGSGSEEGTIRFELTRSRFHRKL